MLASHIHAGTEPLQSLFVNDFSYFSMQWMFTSAACMHLVFNAVIPKLAGFLNIAMPLH